MDNIPNRPIGIFDSGVGGLTVAKEIMEILPNEDIVYFGDTARVPYGSKSKESIFKFSSQIINFLISQNVKTVVIACNTVSSTCYFELKDRFKNIPIIEVVTPGAISAIKETKTGNIGVIGTESTIKSKAYEEKIKEYLKNANVFSKSCPLFVPLAEEGWLDTDITKNIAEVYLKELLENNIDSLVLGCTHYPLLTKSIQKVLNKEIKIINPAKETALKTKECLKKLNLINTNKGNYKFFVSDKNDKFNFICNILFNRTFNVEKIEIDK